MTSIKSISFLGSGNVATHLAKCFKDNGISIDYVYSRNIENASKLSNLVDAKPIDKIGDLGVTSDVYFVCLKDDIKDNVLKNLPSNQLTLIHTSGSIKTNSLSEFSNSFGCFYPLQTFKKDQEVNILEVPIFVEANNSELLNALKKLAESISQRVIELDSEKRKKLHIAAIGINNFTHFLLSSSKEYCESKGLDFSYLETLLAKTISQITNANNPKELQTGPARRGDIEVIKSHLEELKDNQQFSDIYKSINQLILNEFHGDKYKL